MNVGFLNPLDLRAKPDGSWTLLAAFDVDLGVSGIMRVPGGFNTDLASVPRIFWNIIPPFGSHEEAAVAHDWLYRNAGSVPVRVGPRVHRAQFSRFEADRILLAGMKVYDVPAIRRWFIHRAVRIFGASSFRAAPVLNPRPALN